MCFFVAAWTYALAVNFVPGYRNPADKIGAATIGIEEDAGGRAVVDGEHRGSERARGEGGSSEGSDESGDNSSKGTEEVTRETV